MEITGEDYIFFSNKPASQVKEQFVNKVLEMWIEPMVDEELCQNDRIDIFFCKDVLMSEYHDDKGFNTELGGEGCFMFISTKEKLLWFDVGILQEKHINRKSNYHAEIILHDSWCYTLVLPDVIEKNPFSKHWYDVLASILAE